MTKIISLSELISQISDGASIVIGGWGQIRKPMSVLREIVRSGKRDLTIMSLGGLDIDLLIGANAVKKSFIHLPALKDCRLPWAISGVPHLSWKSSRISLSRRCTLRVSRCLNVWNSLKSCP